MAMSKGLKIGLGVMAVGITGTIVYMLIKKMKNKKEEEMSGSESGDTPSVIVHPTPTLPQPTPPVSTSTIPFKNKSEGNAFRGWINDTYPTYAAEIDLDRTGSYNNSYIKKAWNKYGALYNMSLVGAGIGLAAGVGGIVEKAGNLVSKGLNAVTTPAAFSAGDTAHALAKSMEGISYNSNKEFWDITDNTTPAQRAQVKTFFNQHLGQGTKLCNWIEGDFSGRDEAEALTKWGYPSDAGYFESNCEPATPFYMQ